MLVHVGEEPVLHLLEVEINRVSRKVNVVVENDVAPALVNLPEFEIGYGLFLRRVQPLEETRDNPVGRNLVSGRNADEYAG